MTQQTPPIILCEQFDSTKLSNKPTFESGHHQTACNPQYNNQDLVLQMSNIRVTTNYVIPSASNNYANDEKRSFVKFEVDHTNQQSCLAAYNALNSIDAWLTNNKSNILGPTHTQYVPNNRSFLVKESGSDSPPTCTVHFNLAHNKIVTSCFLNKNGEITPIVNPTINQLKGYLKIGSQFSALVHPRKFWFEKGNAKKWGTKLFFLQIVIIPNMKVPIQQQFTHFKIIDTTNNTNNNDSTSIEI